jgi:hypothetical protein
MSIKLKYLYSNLILLLFLICGLYLEFQIRNDGKYMLFIVILYVFIYFNILLSNLFLLLNKKFKFCIITYSLLSIFIFGIISDFYEAFYTEILIFGLINFIVAFKLSKSHQTF